MVSINWNPPTHQVRQFGLVAMVFCSALAGWVWYRHGLTPYVWSLAGIGLGLGLCGLFWPEALRYVNVALMVAVYPIGWIVSFLVLVIIYFGVFTLVATIFRFIGRDALQRRFDLAADTYWQPKAMPTDPRRYLRQY
jgi:hypothetical protein